MKKTVLVLLTILTLALTACGGDYTTVFTEVNTIEGITLTLKEDTLKSSKATFLLTNASAADVAYDPVEYHLEERKDGVWKETLGTRESQWKRDTTEILPAGTAKEIEVNWKGLCGTIGKGEFRMILIVEDQPVAAEFTK